jgi:hypothetical protein
MTDLDLSPAEIDARYTYWLAVIRRQPREDSYCWAIRGSYLLEAAPDVTQRGPGRRKKTDTRVDGLC